ncbi:MAG: hypothetical protein HC836_24310 [Richelia sp. RM2_1_2]|nr:hypothetical protein [Richelia sp. RM2_1_2]
MLTNTESHSHEEFYTALKYLEDEGFVEFFFDEEMEEKVRLTSWGSKWFDEFGIELK